MGRKSCFGSMSSVVTGTVGLRNTLKKKSIMVVVIIAVVTIGFVS